MMQNNRPGSDRAPDSSATISQQATLNYGYFLDDSKRSPGQIYGAGHFEAAGKQRDSDELAAGAANDARERVALFHLSAGRETMLERREAASLQQSEVGRRNRCSFPRGAILERAHSTAGGDDHQAAQLGTASDV